MNPPFTKFCRSSFAETLASERSVAPVLYLSLCRGPVMLGRRLLKLDHVQDLG
jgi:hypothetical protein